LRFPQEQRIELLRRLDKIGPMKWVFQVFLSVFLAYGWIWVGILKEKGAITEEVRIKALILFGAVFAIQQVIITRPRPKDRSEVEKQRQIAENCLGSLLIEYHKNNPEHEKNPVWVRANLALLTRGWIFSYMRIYFTACPSNVGYSISELGIRWEKGVGAIGCAWKTKDITIYDSQTEKYKRPDKALSPDILKIVGYIKSAVALPIISKKGKVIGVLVLDSTQGIDITKFHDPKTVKLLQAFGNTIVPMCFYDGVK